jgi:hypothetical protein
MRAESEAESNSSTWLNHRVPWVVTHVRALAEYRFVVVFGDGTTGEVDMSRLIFAENAGVFEALRDEVVFARVGVKDGVVSWPGDLDLAPDAMYDAIRAEGKWVPG